MRLVTRIYPDGKTKPHHVEFKTDIESIENLHEKIEDLEDVAQNAFYELEEEGET